MDADVEAIYLLGSRAGQVRDQDEEASRIGIGTPYTVLRPLYGLGLSPPTLISRPANERRGAIQVSMLEISRFKSLTLPTTYIDASNTFSLLSCLQATTEHALKLRID